MNLFLEMGQFGWQLWSQFILDYYQFQQRSAPNSSSLSSCCSPDPTQLDSCKFFLHFSFDFFFQKEHGMVALNEWLLGMLESDGNVELLLQLTVQLRQSPPLQSFFENCTPLDPKNWTQSRILLLTAFFQNVSRISTIPPTKLSTIFTNVDIVCKRCLVELSNTNPSTYHAFLYPTLGSLLQNCFSLLTTSTQPLWYRLVSDIFIGSNPNEFDKYFHIPLLLIANTFFVVLLPKNSPSFPLFCFCFRALTFICLTTCNPILLQPICSIN